MYSRTNSVHIFENNVKLSLWDINIFKNLSFKNSVSGIIGSMSSVEEIYFLYQFLNLQNNLGLLVNNKLYSFNTDLPSFYQFNSNFSNIEKSDLIFLIGTNLRFESSMLNLKIRKHFFNKEVPVYTLGNFTNQTYPVIHLGNSPKILIKIAEGSHFFCKILRKSLNPLIITGSEIGFRKDSKALQNVLRYISKKSFLNLKNFSGLNINHNSTSLVNFCELGLALYANSNQYQLNLNKNIQFTQKSVFLTNVDEDLTKVLKNINNTQNDAYFLDTHLNFKAKKNFMNKVISFPITTLYERDSLLINSEGRVQKAFKSVTSNAVARNSEDVLSAIKVISNKNNLSVMTLKNLYLNAPFLKCKTILRNNFYFNFLSIKECQQKIYFTVFNPVVTNFYMTNTLSQNSKTMAECALFLKNKSNFL